MCTPLNQGGQRCATHTRPAYQTAPFGTQAWDEAAAAYASTPTGRMELASSLAAAEAAGDVRSEVAFRHALTEGERQREKAAAFRDALAQRSVAPPAPEQPQVAPVVGLTDDTYDAGDDWGVYDEHDDSYYDDDDDDDEASFGDGAAPAWSPSMRGGPRWPEYDPDFKGCHDEMTAHEFTEQVCENVGVSRAEFEAAAAEYLSQHRVPFLRSAEDLAEGGSPVFLSGLQGQALLSPNMAVATPSLTPLQIRAIAQQALARRPAAAPAPRAPNAETVADTLPADAVLLTELVQNADDPKVLTAVSASLDPLVRTQVAAHASTPADVLARLAVSDTKVEVRAAAARNENLPVEVLTGLMGDRSIKVRAGAARNPSMPVEHLEEMAQDNNPSVVGAVARNPSAPAALYARLAAHRDLRVRKDAARRADIPADIARALATDSDPQVRGAIARNRTTSPEILRGLVRDREQSVRTHGAKNPNLPVGLLRGRLSRDPAPGVRAAIAQHRNTPVATLARLAGDPDAWVRRNVAWNATTPAVLLYALARDTDAGVRSSAQNLITDAAQD